MPENASEIILPRHLETNVRVKYSIGDVLLLDIGSRISDGLELNQEIGYITGKDGKTEKLEVREQRMFTVVGFYQRPNFEFYQSPGYTALTLSDNTGGNSYDVYIKMKKIKNTYGFLDRWYLEKETPVNVNTNLLVYSGASDDAVYNTMLYGLIGVLIGIIMLGSVLLIYNAFSISVSERTKQFGLLSSIGATKRQILRSVLFEAFL